MRYFLIGEKTHANLTPHGFGGGILCGSFLRKFGFSTDAMLSQSGGRSAKSWETDFLPAKAMRQIAGPRRFPGRRRRAFRAGSGKSGHSSGTSSSPWRVRTAAHANWWGSPPARGRPALSARMTGARPFSGVGRDRVGSFRLILRVKAGVKVRRSFAPKRKRNSTVKTSLLLSRGHHPSTAMGNADGGVWKGISGNWNNSEKLGFDFPAFPHSSPGLSDSKIGLLIISILRTYFSLSPPGCFRIPVVFPDAPPPINIPPGRPCVRRLRPVFIIHVLFFHFIKPVSR